MALVLVLAVFMNLLSLITPAPVNNKNQATSPKLDIFETLQKANSDIGDLLLEGDIVKDKNSAAKISGQSSGDVLHNADPCTYSTCIWPKHTDGFVYIPVLIDPKFGKFDKSFIEGVLNDFALVTCIRFTKPRKNDAVYINIIPDTGCWSYVGRTGGIQPLSLQINGCVYRQIIQHEILHALGLHHEHSRSDRDQSVTIHLENTQPDTEYNFQKFQTNNLATSYDFNSVMHYSNYAWSINGQMTIVANHDPSYLFGFAESMSSNDILRVNRLYGCSNFL